MLKLDELFRNQELVFHSADSDFERKKILFFAVFGWYFTPWIRIRGSAYFADSDLDPESQNPVDPTDSDSVSIAAGF